MTSRGFARELAGTYDIKHTVYTVNGFLGDPMQMMPAWTAQALGDQIVWVPLIYDSGSFPLGVGVKDGTTKLANLIAATPGTFMIFSYSEGTIIARNVEDEIRLAGGALADRNDDWVASNKWGDACREAHVWNGDPKDPGGEGISGPDNVVNTDPRSKTWLYQQNEGDVYANRPLSAAGDRMTLIYQFVIERWSGALASAEEELKEFIGSPVTNIWSIFLAVVDYFGFIGKGQAPHMDYPIDDAVAYAQHIIDTVPARTPMPV